MTVGTGFYELNSLEKLLRNLYDQEEHEKPILIEHQAYDSKFEFNICSGKYKYEVESELDDIR